MPKSTKFTRGSIINTSIDIIRSEGADALTARAISKRLGCRFCQILPRFQGIWIQALISLVKNVTEVVNVTPRITEDMAMY